MKGSTDLSEKQAEIIFHESSPLCIKASAGSGKTRILTERVRYFLENTNKKVLALTFTNKAGDEIKERLSDISKLRDRVVVGTFHGFCQSIIENHGKLIGYETMPHMFEDDADRLELIEQAISQIPSYDAEFSKMTTKEKNNFRYKALEFISKMKRSLVEEDEIEEHTQNENVVLLYRSYGEILRSQDAIDFDDLLSLAYDLFISYPKVAALYRRSFYGICIDEAQDLNNAQYQFLKVLAGKELTNIMMVGDSNQSIFHFNGSSSKYMENEFVEDYKAKVINLTENYRSSISVLDAAKSIIPEAEYIEGTVKKGFYGVFAFHNEKDESQWVANEVKRLIDIRVFDDIEGDVTYEKIAVLARNKYLFKSLEKDLKDLDIPFNYKMSPGAIKFESQLMSIFDLALRVKINPLDTLHLKKLKKILGLDKDYEGELVHGTVNSDFKMMLTLVRNLDENGSNLKKSFEDTDFSIGDDFERNMFLNDVEELLVHWKNYATKTDRKSLHQFKNDMALGKTHPLSKHSGVSLSTVHTMKGQEFDIVFIIGLDDETFPDYRAVRSGGIELKQERNNLYVAYTRAKRFLYVTWPQSRMMPWGDTKRRRISRFISSK